MLKTTEKSENKYFAQLSNWLCQLLHFKRLDDCKEYFADLHNEHFKMFSLCNFRQWGNSCYLCF